MKKIFMFILIVSNFGFAQSRSGGLSNLKLGADARSIAMGDLGVASAEGPAAFYYNPALLDGSPGVLLSHNSYIQDVNNEFLSVGFSLFGQPFAVGFASTSIPDIEIRTRPGEAQGKFNAHYFYGGLAASFEVYDKLKAGLGVKYLYEGLFSDEADGYGVDFGLAYGDFFLRNLSLGFSVRNIGTMKKLRNVPTKLPADFRLGANYTVSIQSIESVLNFTGGVQKYFEDDEFHLHAGADFLYSNSFAVRIGYVTGYEAKNVSFGLGVRWGSILFDYSFVPFGYELGNSQFVSLSYDF